jgi:prophage regulatory protein
MTVYGTKLRIERKQDVLDKIRISRSTLYLRIQQGLFVPPISLGKRSVGWMEHETDAILNAYASGQSEAEIKDLVRSIVASRRSLPNSAIYSGKFQHQERELQEVGL